MTQKQFKLAEQADLIVNNYAFTKLESRYAIVNLDHPEKAVVFDSTGKVVETSMDDIEIRIVENYLNRNRRFLED